MNYMPVVYYEIIFYLVLKRQHRRTVDEKLNLEDKFTLKSEYGHVMTF